MAQEASRKGNIFVDLLLKNCNNTPDCWPRARVSLGNGSPLPSHLKGRCKLFQVFAKTPLHWGVCFYRPPMPLPKNFHPKQGQYLICDFERGFIHPEITKIRPVVVISKTTANNTHRRLCTVVVLSTTAPSSVMSWHYKLTSNPNPFKAELEAWAKCDLIYTVSYDRLAKPYKKTNRGERQYADITIGRDELEKILGATHSYLFNTPPPSP